ncbi:LacI family transcriptional regulator [Mycoplasmopsis canis]|uniref:LacI family transcriptional regulator n=1 Tax=Mycoplasmopsis canis TaxID=29555 RepID=A0A449AR59_9BACT|nr:LacI family DNA-binding transcriptional regulator [Mycoplasmopsis canis]VEU69028.1 LacI family transcriptional regulator [Mycoplasmopsis canis]
MNNNNNKKQISYKEIAEQAGTSISTISRYYNDGYVSERTRQKILEIVTKNEYFPNHGARLIRGKDNSIFVVMPIWTQNLYNSIISGIITSASKSERRVNTTYSNSSTVDYIETIRYALSWKPLAIVVLVPQHDKDLFDFLKKVNDTIVVVYGHRVPGLNWIKPDLKTGFSELVEKFVDANTKKVAFVIDSRLSESQKTERQNGFEIACRDLGVEGVVLTLETKKDLAAIVELSKKLKMLWIKNIVCSTHESYVSITTTLGTKEYNVTDIGYQSVYDTIKNYKAKIFIDYPRIGMMIDRIISENKETGDLQERTLNTMIISDKN